ncbi:inositol polyphosphate 1-phosphatase isoform X1 [Rissa tridactyla]|uniref:inositol polyphosphate 1-phosphatase isoform X1 n=1 Tax=Rissa tridactyla TaxID=75485 RepID=UPI0023BA68ED|nr:inositol polyphosphate 1-phosphatase isoform X1 [Rissa tridactyla]
MAGLLQALVGASEKAAHIARLCRREEPLFQLLVAEKTGADRNRRFLQDFKTLADVLIQEVIKHDLGKEFPELQGHIHGEESNEFRNGQGETVTVRVCATPGDTAALLLSVLEPERAAAELLAAAVHRDVTLEDAELAGVALSVPPQDLAIWIDPIDSTNEYIAGREDVAPVDGIAPAGLCSALVLIGAYDRRTGCPVLGVINEPFFRRDPPDPQVAGTVPLGRRVRRDAAVLAQPPAAVPRALPGAEPGGGGRGAGGPGPPLRSPPALRRRRRLQDALRHPGAGGRLRPLPGQHLRLGRLCPPRHPAGPGRGRGGLGGGSAGAAGG